MSDLDRLNRSIGVRTIVLDRHSSVYSPYTAVTTLKFREMVEHEVALVTALFEVEPTTPIPVFFQPVQGLRPQLVAEKGGVSIGPMAEPPRNRVEGIAAPELVIVYVEPPKEMRGPDGLTLEGSWAAEGYQGTLRHELVHFCSNLAGLEGDLWFREGLAHAVELGGGIVEGKLRVESCESVRVSAAKLPRAHRSLRRVLAATEDIAAIQAGTAEADLDVRLLATTFVFFLLERRGEPTFLERVRAIHSLSQAELLALEPAWQSWIGPPDSA